MMGRIATLIPIPAFAPGESVGGSDSGNAGTGVPVAEGVPLAGCDEERGGFTGVPVGVLAGAVLRIVFVDCDTVAVFVDD